MYLSLLPQAFESQYATTLHWTSSPHCACMSRIADAMDVMGGAGICRGKGNMIGNGYMTVPIAITVEGANILTRSMITFGQGLNRGEPPLHLQPDFFLFFREICHLVIFSPSPPSPLLFLCNVSAHPNLINIVNTIEKKDDVKGFTKEAIAFFGHLATNAGRSLTKAVTRPRSKGGALSNSLHFASWLLHVRCRCRPQLI